MCSRLSKCHCHVLQGFLRCLLLEKVVRQSWNRNRGSGSLEEERCPLMSPEYDSNVNSNYSKFIHSVPPLSQSITLSNVGHLNCYSLSNRHFQHMTAKVLFRRNQNWTTWMTETVKVSVTPTAWIMPNFMLLEFLFMRAAQHIKHVYIIMYDFVQDDLLAI